MEMNKAGIEKMFSRCCTLDKLHDSIVLADKMNILYYLPSLLMVYTNENMSWVVLAIPDKDKKFTNLLYFNKEKTEFKFVKTDSGQFGGDIITEST